MKAQLAAMASDPHIQSEIAAINEEFAVTEMDGFKNL
ncbi:No_hits_found [Microseira wollei NIES-4236]|uniref:No_hits_found n=1 Tax=Microseira wollei NIES-4236 TaxID=2530354 RepID=A0AAV3XSK9_9CYAN|nr:No_hits_found [Microseira wollei NIES-4236]